MNRQQWQRAIEPAPENFHRAVAHALRTKEERQPMKPFRVLKALSRIRLQISGTQTTHSFATWRTFLCRPCPQ